MYTISYTCKWNSQFIMAGEIFKVVLVFAMKAYRQSRCTTTLILNLDIG
jgi:hypothetical protein